MASTVQVRYIGPISPIDIPAHGIGQVKTGDVIEVPAEAAGRAPGDWQVDVDRNKVDPAHATSEEPDGTLNTLDPGEGLLAQTGMFEAAGKTPAKSTSTTTKEG